MPPVEAVTSSRSRVHGEEKYKRGDISMVLAKEVVSGIMAVKVKVSYTTLQELHTVMELLKPIG